jgi:hypothetical protein
MVGLSLESGGEGMLHCQEAGFPSLCTLLRNPFLGSSKETRKRSRKKKKP